MSLTYLYLSVKDIINDVLIYGYQNTPPNTMLCSALSANQPEKTNVNICNPDILHQLLFLRYSNLPMAHSTVVQPPV